MIPLCSLFSSPKRTINSKKYGVNLIQFTHSPTTAIHASTKIDGIYHFFSSNPPFPPLDTIRYLSLHDNKYIRYFQSHTKRYAQLFCDHVIFSVVCLCMSPIDDAFLSGALDRTVRLWDLRSQNCHASSCSIFVQITAILIVCIC